MTIVNLYLIHSMIKDLNIFFTTHTNISIAKNFAMEKTNGSLIAFLDVDDW